VTTCRWSTYDALRLSREPDPRVPATLRERVWSSPIWIDASSSQGFPDHAGDETIRLSSVSQGIGTSHAPTRHEM